MTPMVKPMEGILEVEMVVGIQLQMVMWTLTLVTIMREVAQQTLIMEVVIGEAASTRVVLRQTATRKADRLVQEKI